MNRTLRHRAVTAALVFGIVGAWAPASVFAHVEFEDPPASVAPNSDIALTLHVANEREATNFNVAVATRLPENWTGVSCEEKATWTCEIVTVSQRVEIHFTKDEGASAGPEDETFEFTLHSSATLGLASFPTLQTYDTGEEVGWIGDPGTDEPAPTLEVADQATTTTAGEATTTTAATSTTIAAATTTLAPATTTAEVTTTAAETTTSATAETTVDTVTILDSTATTAADSDSDDDANTGLIIAIILLVLVAVAATIWYLRRRKPPVPPTGGTPTAVIAPIATDPTIVNPTAAGPVVTDPAPPDPGPLDQ